MSDHDASPKEWTHAHSLRHGSHKWLAKRLRIAAALTRLQQASATAPAATSASSATNSADAANTIANQSSALPPRMPSPFTFAPYAASTAPLNSHLSSDAVVASSASHRKRSSVEKILLIDANSTDAVNQTALLPALSPHTPANDIEEGMEDESSSSDEAGMDEEDEASDSAHLAHRYALTPQLLHSHLHGPVHPHSRFVHQTPPARFHAPLPSHHQHYSPLLAHQQLNMYSLPPTPAGLPPPSSHRSAAASPSPSPPPSLSAAAVAAAAAGPRNMLIRSYSDIDFNAAAQLDTMHAYALQQLIHQLHHAPLMKPPVDWSKCRLCLNQLLQLTMQQQDVLNASTQSAYSPVHPQQYRIPSPFTTPAVQSHSAVSSLRATPISIPPSAPAATLEAVGNSLKPTLPPPNLNAVDSFPPAASLSASPLVPIPSQPASTTDVSVSPAATSVGASASPPSIAVSASAPPVATLPPVAPVPPLITLSRNFLILLSILKETDGRDKIAKVVQYGGRTLRILLHKIPSFTWWSMFLWRQLTTGKMSRVLLALKVLIWENRGQTVKNLGELTKNLLEISPPSAVSVAASAAGAAAAAVKAVADPAHPGLHATSMASALVASYTADTSALSESLYRLPFYSGVISRLDVLTAALSSARRIIRLCKWTYTLPGWVKTFEEWRKQVQAGIEKEMEKKLTEQQAEMEKEQKEKEEQINKNATSTTLITTTTTTTVETVPSQPKSAPFRFSHPHPTHVWRRLPWLSSVELLDLSIAVMTDVSDDFEWLSKYKLFPDELGYKCGRIAMILWFTTVVLDLALTFRILRHYIYQRGEIQRQIAETEKEYDSSRYELGRLQHKREEKTYRRLVRELKRTSAERFSGGRYEPPTPANNAAMPPATEEKSISSSTTVETVPSDVNHTTSGSNSPHDPNAHSSANLSASSWSVISASSAADGNETSREVRSNSDSNTSVISNGSSSSTGDQKGHSSAEETSPVDVSQSTPTKTATDPSLSSSICIVPSASNSSSSSTTAASTTSASSKPVTPASPAKVLVASSSKKAKKAREKKKSKKSATHNAKHDRATGDADDEQHNNDDDGEEEPCLTSEVAAAQFCGKVSHESHAVADCQKQAVEEARLMLREREFSQRHLELTPSSSSQQQADQKHMETVSTALMVNHEADAMEDDSGEESDEDTISLVHARTVESLHRLSDLHSQQSATRVSLFLQYLNFAKFAADLGCALPMALNVHKEWDGLVQSTGLISGLLGIYKLFITTKPAQ